jgi:threonine/homoserine/homoserine lactone efflux protein
MQYTYLLKCFLIGASAASAVGPIFVLTFNKSALRGFLKGFFTACGAALGDGFLFVLGMFGVLSILEESRRYQVGIDLAGGILLFAFGISMIFSHKHYTTQPLGTGDSPTITVIKTFISTALNPLTIIFFMFLSAEMTPLHTIPTMGYIFAGGSMIALGSLSVLTIVAYIASSIGKAISFKNLRIVSIVTGCIMLGIGSYFFIDAIRVIAR